MFLCLQHVILLIVCVSVFDTDKYCISMYKTHLHVSAVLSRMMCLWSWRGIIVGFLSN